MSKWAIEVNELSYKYSQSSIETLHKVSLQVPFNTINLLVGSNGSGKTTLLKILGGKNLCLNGDLKLDGENPFSSGFRNTINLDDGTEINRVCYFGTDWVRSEFINRDISVLELTTSLGYQKDNKNSEFTRRGDYLMEILEVSLDWRMHMLSDGQKRRVQLIMGLLKPFKILLLDEITIDLDVVARFKLFEFLKFEVNKGKTDPQRQCCIIYCTHIFDGLNNFYDRVLHLHRGELVGDFSYNKIKYVNGEEQTNSTADNDGIIRVMHSASLHPLILKWLLKDENKL
ncbi:CCR4-associated factor 16 [Hanseniaspora uvarum DSM 2768]|nr:CCR4-associated factor 16 [Hanseniaspora uvarum DSM 2768]